MKCNFLILIILLIFCIQRKMASPSNISSFSSLSLDSELIPDTPRQINLASKEFEPGQYVKFYMGQLFSMKDFYMNPTVNWYALEKQQRQLQNWFYRKPTLKNLGIPIVHGMHVAVPVFFNEEFHRAKIIGKVEPKKVDKNDNDDESDDDDDEKGHVKYTILLIDYGNRMNVSEERIFPLPDKFFSTMDAQAVHCKLAIPEDVKMPDERRGYGIFFKACLDQQLGAKLIEFDEVTGQWTVEIKVYYKSRDIRHLIKINDVTSHIIEEYSKK